MWRRFGDVTFAAVVAVAVTLEAAPLLVVTWTLLRHLTGSASGPRLAPLILGAIASATLGLVLVTSYVLAYQYVSSRRDSKVAARRRRWVARWLDVLFQGAPPPGGQLGRAAVGALLDLRETLRGAEADRVGALLARYGVSTRLTQQARIGRVASRLDALDALSQARLPAALPALVASIDDPVRAVRVAAARAAARTLAAIGASPERDRAAVDIVTALERGALSFGVVEEMLLLSEDAAPALIGPLLGRDDVSPASQRAALDAVARLQLLDFAREAAPFLRHRDPEVRSAALRAVAKIGLLQPGDRSSVLTALGDPIDFVRIHAASAARLLPREQALAVLWTRLGDRSWWVRRAAADAFAALGPAGLGMLARAAGRHPDRYARDIAAQTLRDHAPAVVQALAG